MTDNITGKMQRLNVQGKLFNVNTKMYNVELAAKIKYKAWKVALLRKEIRKGTVNKDNTMCYLVEDKYGGFQCSNVPLVYDHPELVSDKFIPSLALFLADKYPAENENDANVFIYTYKDRPSATESIKEYYGIISIGNLIYEESIYDNLEDLEQSINLLSAFGIEKYNIYHLKIDDKKENILPVLKEVDTSDILYIDDLYNEDTDFSPYLPTSIVGGFSPKQMILAVVMGIGLYGSNYYIDNYKDSYHASIVNGEFLLPLEKSERYLAEFKQKEIKNGAEKRLIYEQGKSEFISSYYSNLYSTAEIHENFNVIRALFPDYLAEWQLSKIVFDSRSSLKSDQMFFVVFDRIKGSIGVYDELDRRIQAISQKTGIRIEAKELIKYDEKGTGFQGESRVYMIDFGYERKLEMYKNSLVSMDFLKERDKKIIDLSVAANQTKANIYGLMNDAALIKNEELIFGNKHYKIGVALDYEVNVLKKMYNEIIDLTQVPVKSMSVPKNTSFDEYKYISLKQRDSLFEWSYPALKAIYPDPKKIKKDNLAVFAKEFSFNLKSDKKLSLGYTYYLEALERLNLTQIQIRFATYNVKDQSYLIEGRFFEQIDMIP